MFLVTSLLFLSYIYLIKALHSSKMGSQMASRARNHLPCAACKMLRRRCDSNCKLAPYFPHNEMEKFVCVHKVFGACNVVKMIQIVEETKREDAVKALVYEAEARLRDPVYGSAGAAFHLHKMVQQLEAQLESMRTQVVELQEQRNKLLGILMNIHQGDPVFPIGDDGTLANDPAKFPVDCEWIL